MRIVTIRLSGEGFSTAIVGMRDWLEKHRYEPTAYRYDQKQDTVLVSVDFTVDAQAQAFAKRFDGQSGDRRTVSEQPSDAIGVSGSGGLIHQRDLGVTDVGLGKNPHQPIRKRHQRVDHMDLGR
jgi:hypothetical protein